MNSGPSTNRGQCQDAPCKGQIPAWHDENLMPIVDPTIEAAQREITDDVMEKFSVYGTGFQVSGGGATGFGSREFSPHHQRDAGPNYSAIQLPSFPDVCVSNVLCAIVEPANRGPRQKAPWQAAQAQPER
jgi:hypothetical protein